MTDHYENTSALSAWFRELAQINEEGNREFDQEHELPGLLRRQAE